MKKLQSHWTMKFRSNPASETYNEMQYLWSNYLWSKFGWSST